MKNKILLLVVSLGMALTGFAQGAHNIKINEVLTNNTANIEDEYGQRGAWVELCNCSFSTYNVRGMYIATDKAVLNPSLSAPERQKLMSVIPNGDARTVLTGHQHILFYLNSNPAKGTLHITAKAEPGAPLWVALYDGNGIDLLDSLTVPSLAANESFSRKADGAAQWEVRKADDVTPGIANRPHVNDKLARTKAEDPHGFAITILAMGTVFTCLALLYIFFRLLGLLMDHFNRAKKIANTMPLKPVTKTVQLTTETLDKTVNILNDPRTKGADKRLYIALISMALKQYQDDVHDVESGIISIKPHTTTWGEHTHFTDVSHLKHS